MPTTLTVKGQVTIPKHIRDALGLSPGMPVEFDVTPKGEVLICRAAERSAPQIDRFEAARGRADVSWRTQELMALLRGDD